MTGVEGGEVLDLFSAAKRALRKRVLALGADLELRRCGRRWCWYATWGGRRDPVLLGVDLASAAATVLSIERRLRGRGVAP